MFKSHSPLVVLALCVACGNSFNASGGGGGSSLAGQPAFGGESNSAGSESGGAGGEPNLGGAGTSDGSGGSSVGTGGAEQGGSGSTESGGNAGTSGSGSAGAPDCATLKQDYRLALEKARLCEKGATAQCSPSSTLPSLTCGNCPVLVNAKSEATNTAKRKYQALQDAQCDPGPLCGIACVAYTGASCSSSGTGSLFVCTASSSNGP